MQETADTKVSVSEREQLVTAFLEKAGWATAKREYLQGDASIRRYERLALNGVKAVLMDWPAGPDAPVDGGVAAYSKLAHLAEDVRPFVAVGTYLKSLGLRVPDIISSDLTHGFLLLEDIGTDDFGGVIDRGEGPQGEALDDMYRACVDVLVALQGAGAPEALPVGDGTTHHVPAFDNGIYRNETALALDWYMPVVMGKEAETDLRAEYDALLTTLWPLIESGPRTLFLRDFHSPNILWQSTREGLERVGLIDYQDALIGSLAYDPVSFLQDARRDVPVEREKAMLTYYVAAMKELDAHFDADAFDAAYAVLGAERALRLMGLWPRLLKRDNKPHYLAHMARTQDYLRRNLAHPLLSDLSDFVERHFLEGAPAPGQIAGTRA